MACRFAEVGDSLATILGREPGDVMKSYSASRRGGAVAVRRRATLAVMSATFALMFAAAIVGTSRAQDTSKGDSSWERVDSVLVVPPVYRPDASEPADACAEDCASVDNPGAGELPSAVTGTADNPANASAGTADDPTDDSAAADGSTPDGSGSQEQQAAAAGGDQQSADSLDPSIGSAQDYQEQQAAQELGNYGIVQVPAVIIGVPVGSYYPRGTSALAAPASAPARSLSSPAWMPPPMPRVVPQPSIVPHGVPGTVGAFPGGFPGGFHGGFAGSFHGGFSQMSGFRGGFGHR
jgi:hypothetical protein